MLKSFDARLKILHCRGLLSFKNWKCSLSVNIDICNRIQWKLKTSNANTRLSGMKPAENRHWNQAHDTYLFLVLSALCFCWEYIVSNFSRGTFVGCSFCFPRAKRPEHFVNHPLPSSAAVKERVEPYLYSPPVPSWHVKGWSFVLFLFRINVLHIGNYSSFVVSFMYGMWRFIIDHVVMIVFEQTKLN